jgi:tetratricopeptide (TPR) repeat protein
MDPYYGQAHAAIGNIALIQGDNKTALVNYRKALHVDPELEKEMIPLIQTAVVKSTREPLIMAEVDLKKVHRLVMANQMSELETLLAKDIPLDVLAKDTFPVTPSEIGELVARIATITSPDEGSVRYRLFSAYLLYFSQQDLNLAVALIERAATQADNADIKKAYLVLGQMREQMGNFNLAVDAYLMAFQSGLPDAVAAEYISKVYGLDVESMRSKSESAQQELLLPPSIELSIPVLQHRAQRIEPGGAESLINQKPF